VQRLSVCIVNWNTRADLQACLTALAAHPFHEGDQEIIVLDNDSADGSAEMVASEFSQAILIANTVNANYARGTNQALAATTGDCILLLNPDARVEPGALDALVRAAQAHPEAAAVAARLTDEAGITERSVRGFPSPIAILWDVLKMARLFPGDRSLTAYRMPWFDYDAAGPAPQPMASCFLITRPALERVGPMDERFPLYFNDVDWCFRAHQAGFTIWYTPDAIAIHGHGGTTKRVRKAAVWESHRALLRFWAKHYKETTAVPLYVLMTAIVTFGAWMRTGRWGEALGKDGGETTPENLHRELERAG